MWGLPVDLKHRTQCLVLVRAELEQNQHLLYYWAKPINNWVYLRNGDINYNKNSSVSYLFHRL